MRNTAFYKRVALFLFFFFCLISYQARAQNLDIDILQHINPRYPTSTYWSATSSSAYWLSGGVVAGTLVYGFIKKDKEAQYHSYEALLALGISAVVTETLKKTINRARPADEYPNEIFVTKPEHGEAFPSGHTTIAFATATTLALEYRKWYVVVPAYAWAASVGYARMYEGYHAPSDVLGGAAVGIGSGYLSHWLSKKIFMPPSKKKESNRAF